MDAQSDNSKQIENLADSTLSALTTIAIAAKEKINNPQVGAASSLVNSQTFTGANAINRLNETSQSLRNDYAALTNEPAIARLIYEDDMGDQHTLYITRSIGIQGSAGLLVASAKAPLGRLASLDVGDSAIIEIAGQNKEFTLLEVALLKPKQDSEGWDAPHTIYKHEDFGVQTIVSLRQVLQGASLSGDDFDSWLDETDQVDNIQTGIVHEIRTAMGLRDQPILDKFQDDIFRLPIDSQLFIAGPPGTGKTTTLIKRLGQKLDKQYLTEQELRLIDSLVNETAHEQSWIMFTPTDLLKHYVKEAFAREQVPASDDHIRTWDKTRRDLARNVLGLLQSGTTKGKFIFQSDAHFLRPEIERNSKEWFSKLQNFHQEQVYADLQKALEQAKSAASIDNEALINKIETVFVESGPKKLSNLYASLQSISAELEPLIQDTNEQVEKLARTTVNALYKKDKIVFERLATFLTELGAEELIDEDDEAVDDDQDEEPITSRSKFSPQDAAKELIRLVKSIGRNKYLSRSIAKKSKPGKVIEFLGDVMPDDTTLKQIGRLALTISSLKRFLNAPKRYVSDIPSIFKRFRKANPIDYLETPKGQFISSVELDAVVLLTLNTARELMQLSFIKRQLDLPKFGFLSIIQSHFKNQVLVDEATDFSVLQLACMQCLTNISTQSFFACGDFNQRLTEFGVSERSHLEWLPLASEFKTINTVYRQSQKLNDLSRMVLSIYDGDISSLGKLPENYNHQGVSAVLAEDLDNIGGIADWLAQRISEINRSVGKMPTVGVLVESESSVQPLADKLSERLMDVNLVAEACLGGKTLGENTDVRVFSAEHIKGLEFEAVFFVNIDKLADNQPLLFDKYLYVGVTRASTYLGITCNHSLPINLEPLREHLKGSWVA